MQCLIIDDDQMSRKALEKCIEHAESLVLAGSYDNALSALDILGKGEIDILFLDVEMPKMTGLELLETLNDPPFVVLVTAKSEYAVEAFQYNVVDYIVKPVELSRFLKSVQKVKERLDNVSTDIDRNNVFIKVESNFVRLDLREIQYIEALGDYIKIYTPTQRFVVLSTMKAIHAKLPEQDFFRVHKSYIVRLDKITSIEGNSLPIANKVIPISRSYKDILMSKLRIL